MKVKLLKKECQADPSQYEWRVGKGCFTIGHASPTRTLKPCAPDEIRNPDSERCVKRSGKIGISIIKGSGVNKLSATKPKDVIPSVIPSVILQPPVKVCKQKCAADEICNPVSGRCVKRSGKIGQQLLAKQKTISTPPPPKARSPPKVLSLPNPDEWSHPTAGLPCGKMPGVGRITCIELPIKNIKYIVGPCSFHYFKYAGRNIYLFGEAHLTLARSSVLMAKTDMKPSNAIMFAGFVNSLVMQNPTRTYDLMYESPFFFEKSQKEHNRLRTSISPTLTSIYNMFYDCINPSKRRFCPYPNLRTQNVDYRHTVVGKKVMDMWPNRAQHISEMINLISTGKVAKQIEAIKDPIVITALLKYVAFALKGNQSHHSPVIMDIYGIARTLREFDKKIDKHNSQFKGTSENIIYYAGSNHIENMRLFFTKFMGIPESPINIVWHPKDDADGGCKSFIKLDVGNKALNFVH